MDWKLAVKNGYSIVEDTLIKYCGKFRVKKTDTLFVDERDGNSYRLILVGDVLWMAENLKYKTEYDSYCFDDDSMNCEKYGRFYTFLRANRACPDGWSVSSDKDWKELEKHLGMDESRLDDIKFRGVIASKLLPEGDSGFDALYGGAYSESSGYIDEGSGAYFWTDSYSGNKAWTRGMYIGYEGIHRDSDYLENAYSVRCVKSFREPVKRDIFKLKK